MVQVTGKTGYSSVETGAETPTPPPKEPREESSTDPNILSTAAADANFRLQRLEGRADSPQDPAADPALTRIGSLEVGDRYASRRLNSAATVEAAGRVSATDRMTLNVAPPPSPPEETPPPSLPQPAAAEPVAFHSTSTGFVSFRLRVAGEDEEEIRRRLALLSPGSSRPASPGGGPSPSPAPASSTSTVSGSPASQRYVFAVRDVHSMGGSSSALSIRDGSGNLVGRYELPTGDSRLTVDLPPGEYTVEAQSGSRSMGGPGDQLDNFRVEVYSAGPSPGSEGGDSAGGSGNGGGSD